MKRKTVALITAIIVSVSGINSAVLTSANDFSAEDAEESFSEFQIEESECEESDTLDSENEDNAESEKVEIQDTYEDADELNENLILEEDQSSEVTLEESEPDDEWSEAETADINTFANSDTLECGDYTYKIVGTEAIIVKYTGSDPWIKIPSNINNYKVTEIGYQAFKGCTFLKQVDIPESVTEIGKYAFYNCAVLEGVSFGKKIQKVGSYAFYKCAGLKRIKFQKDNEKAEESQSTVILESGAFQDCSSLKQVMLSSDIKEVGDQAFKGCTLLEQVDIPEGVKKIGVGAFSGCINLGDISLPEGLEEVGYSFIANTAITRLKVPKTVNRRGTGSIVSVVTNGATDGAGALRTVVFEEGMTKIPNYFCSNYSSNTTLVEVEIPESVTEIGKYAFYNCAGLEGVSFPEALQKIGASAFYGCSSLEEAILPWNLNFIGSWAFKNCTKLQTVRIPKAVTSILTDSFSGCSDLTIYGYSGSYAETYAHNNNIPFVVLDDEDEESGEGFNLKKDGYCVINATKCFSYDSWTNWFGINGYKIPLERYQEVFGDSYTKHIYDQNVGSWGGNCFGMAATAVLFYKGKLPVVNYTHDVGILAAGGYDGMVSSWGKTYLKLNKNSDLTKLIERYQIWQDSYECIRSRHKDILNYQSGTYAEAFANVLNKIRDTKEPLIVLIGWDKPDGKEADHALVVDSSRTPQDLGNNWFRIYLYDPNNPYFEYFDKKTPDVAYTQAENRFLDVNVSNGQWRMAATVNGNGEAETSIGYDDSGNKLRNSTIYFSDVNDYPTNFNQKATFSPSGNTMSITYASDNFEVYDSANILIYKMKNGVVSYINDEIVKQSMDCGYIEGLDSGISNGKLMLPKGQYRVTVEKGAISYLTDDDYSGIVTKERAVVQNIDSTTLSITSTGTNKVNVVIEDVQSEKYTSIETDIMANNSGCEISLDNDKLNFNTEIEQQVDISVISDDQEREIEDVPVEKSTNIELKEHIEHSWDLGKITKKATCIEKGIKTYTCIICGKTKTEDISTINHKYDSWKITKPATVLKKGYQTRKCYNCGRTEKKNIEKLKPTVKINVSSIPLKMKQSTTKVKVTGLARGDYIKSWKSSNSKVVTVNTKGQITAKNKRGKVTITVTMASGLKRNIKVTVQKAAVVAKKITGVSKFITLKEGKTTTLKPVISPITVTSKTTYKSSNEKVAIVNSKGKITAKKKGTVIITVKNGKRTVKCKVTVK